MPGANKRNDTNRNINQPDREESGMQGSSTPSWDEDEDVRDYPSGNDHLGGTKGKPGTSGGSSGGRSGGSSR